MATTSSKPSYLGLLNAIALAESRAHRYLTAWAERTCDEEVRAVLRTVALREGEHGMSFAKRIDELGFAVRPRESDEEEDRRTMEIVTSDRSDLEKMEALGLHRLDTGDEPDIFEGFFKDHTIDIRTGELLGRYIAEERDSARLLRSCWEALRARAAGGRPPDGAAAAPHDRLAAIEAKLEGLRRALEELRGVLSAPDGGGAPAATANGGSAVAAGRPSGATTS
jgi:rubrerythrin